MLLKDLLLKFLKAGLYRTKVMVLLFKFYNFFAFTLYVVKIVPGHEFAE